MFHPGFSPWQRELPPCVRGEVSILCRPSLLVRSLLHLFPTPVCQEQGRHWDGAGSKAGVVSALPRVIVPCGEAAMNQIVLQNVEKVITSHVYITTVSKSNNLTHRSNKP